VSGVCPVRSSVKKERDVAKVRLPFKSRKGGGGGKGEKKKGRVENPCLAFIMQFLQRGIISQKGSKLEAQFYAPSFVLG